MEIRAECSSDPIRLSRDLGMLRVGAAVPQVRVADVDHNTERIIALARKAADQGTQVLVFPEMSITGYTLGDLVQHGALLAKAETGLGKILEATAASGMAVMVGLPVVVEQKIYNCAAVLASGRIAGLVPKTHLPTSKEFYEDRWFVSSRESCCGSIEFAGQQAPFGADLLFALRGIPGAQIGIELCEDLWVPISPHQHQALAGATILVNLSASNELLGKADWRRLMVTSESGRCIAAYCYASSGIGESSNDVVFGGHSLIVENGIILAESKLLSEVEQLLIADIDLERLAHDRRVATSFGDKAARVDKFRVMELEVADPRVLEMRRPQDAHPFVPSDPARRDQRCREIFSMQVGALSKKLTGANTRNLILGVSGGLDSTLSLLVGVKTLDFLGLPWTNLHAFSLPGFGTTRRTRDNASRLCKSLGVSFQRVNIGRSCSSHFRDLEHSGAEDLVFENVQARYRTEFLFNKANALGGIVLGTGDLTETALGWCTFAGDHLSHYHVNTSVPKTLVRYLIQWVSQAELNHPVARKALVDILNTPISPELLRPKNGVITQKSEDTIGPVELADFYLYPFIRFGMRPGKVLYLANEVRKQGLFDGDYSLDDLCRWQRSFIRRFFASQFKRTCLPEGPKIGSVSLSPRGDWRMPSDAEARLWLQDLEEMYQRLANC